MDIYESTDYKSLLRQQVKASYTVRKLTMRKIAHTVGIQYTYLSRALNQEKSHLSEDHVYAICQMLQLYPEEIEYVFLLRSLSMASNPGRRKFLEDKLNRIRQARRTNATVQHVDSRQLNREMDHLFDPFGLIVVISLDIPEYREKPDRLCAPLGLSATRLLEILRRLSELGFIELDDDGRSVKKVIRSHFHYGTDHPLMRVHQTLLRNLSGTQLARTSEEDKNCFMVTFSTDDETVRAAREKFQVFLRELEQLVKNSRPRRTFQMNFELFKWL